MEQLPQNFDINRSAIKEAYILLGAKTPGELSRLYTTEDQKIAKSAGWDYNNPDLVTNKVRNILESADESSLTEGEKGRRKEILWFWYHHAISCAIWRYQNKEAAQLYSQKALEYQEGDHPNHITRLLYFLVRDKLKEAKNLAQTIEEDPEKTTAQDLIKEYENRGFSKISPDRYGSLNSQNRP
ncbi:MAG: hypothetical protein ACE5HI_13290 [bacterium]